MRGGTLLAILTTCKPSGEMFSLVCDFQPTEAFAQVKPLFDEFSLSEDTEVIDRTLAKIHETGIQLCNVETNLSTRWFVLHINGQNASLRYVDEDM